MCGGNRSLGGGRGQEYVDHHLFVHVVRNTQTKKGVPLTVNTGHTRHVASTHVIHSIATWTQMAAEIHSFHSLPGPGPQTQFLYQVAMRNPVGVVWLSRQRRFPVLFLAKKKKKEEAGHPKTLKHALRILGNLTHTK